MKLSLQGYVRNQTSLFSDGLYELLQNGEEVNNALYVKIEQALDGAKCTTLTLYDLIMALLREDMSKEEAIDFLALNAEKLLAHKHTNDLITFDIKKENFSED